MPALTLLLLIRTIVVFYLFTLLFKSLIVGTKCVFKHEDLQRIDLNLNRYLTCNFHPKQEKS